MLARGATILVVGGLAAGCSSGASSLTDGLVTNSTSANAPVVVAQANQPYPGDVQTGRRAQPNHDRIVRPKVPVGGGTMQSNAPASLPAPSAAAAPVYTAPAGGQPAISSAPLPAPQGGGAAAATASRPGNETLPAPSAPRQREQPASQMAVLPQAPRPQEKSQGQGQNGSTSSSGGSYTVVSGDTLYGISRKTGASVDSIKQANGLSTGLIQVGQKLTIPSGSGAGATVVASTAQAKPETNNPDPVTTAASAADKKPETPKVSAYTPPSSKDVLEDDKDTTEMAALTPDSTGVGRLRWPARGRIVSSFGASSGGRTSDGIDIAVPEGTSVRAAENGIVIYAGDGLKGFGNTVLVRHEDGLVTVYGHASEIKVKRGDNVKRGQEIALSGMSGDADRPKLHFEVRKGTNPVDPTTYLE